MKLLTPQSPYIWPEPRALEHIGKYQSQPPFGELAQRSHAIFGTVTALTAEGVDVLGSWLESKQDLKIRLIVIVYPTCATRHPDLTQLLDLIEQYNGRLLVHIYALEGLSDRASNALCFLTTELEAVRLVIGTSENLGLQSQQNGHVNFVFRAEPALTEAFKRHFDWLWARSPEMTVEGVARIPSLRIPEGTEEAARSWRSYMSEFRSADGPFVTPHVDPETGDVILRNENGEVVTPPTEELGLPKLDQLAEQVARLYNKGALVSIDKLSRIPPLDAPLNPSAFGETSDIQKGGVSRTVSMRVSVIDAKTLKDINKCRNGLRTLMTRFTFGLADNMRWIPSAARGLLELELARTNENGQKLIGDLLKGDVSAFIEGKRDSLTADINAMYVELGRSDRATDDVIERTINDLKDRLGKAQSANFMPKLTYSLISFSRAENTSVSPWGQAYSLLADIAAFPREALTNKFFFSGLKIDEDDFIEAMNVADDAACKNLHSKGIKERCKLELNLLSRIEKAPVDARDRCELVSRLIAGDEVNSIDEALKKLVANA